MRWGLAAIVLGATAAQAQVRLDYTAPSGCPSAKTFQALVAARVGHDPFGGAEGHRLLVEVVSGPGKTFVSVVRLMAPDGSLKGRREQSGPSCARLVEQVAITVALALDPLLQRAAAADAGLPASPAPFSHDAGPPEPTPPHDAGPPPVTRDAGSAFETTPRPPDAGTAAPSWSLFLGAGVEHGSAPTLQPGAAVDLRLAWGFSSLALGLRAQVPLTIVHAAGRYRVLPALVSFAPCLHVRPLFACASVAAGVVTATGIDTAGARESVGFLSEVGARAGVDFGLTERHGLRLMISAGWSPTTILVVAGEQELWRSSALRLSGHLGWTWGL